MSKAHSALLDADGLHEAKGIEGASASQIIVADGLGSSSSQFSVLSHHAEMTITNNATVTAVTAAADATLNTDTDYVKITAGWASTHADGISFSTDKLVVPIDGDYMLSFWASVKIPLNNNFIGVKYSINDSTPYSAQKIVSQSATTNDYRNLFASGMLSLTAGDTLSVYVAGTKSDNLVIEEAGMQLWLLHE